MNGELKEFDPFKLEFKEFCKIINLDLFLNSLKKNIFIGSLSQTIKAIKYNWAHNSIDLLLKNIFYSKNKFSEKEFKEVVNLRNSFKNKISKDNSLDNQKNIRDGQIKNTPLESSNQVSDARSERIITSGIDTWTSKQNGLSNGKLLL